MLCRAQRASWTRGESPEKSGRQGGEGAWAGTALCRSQIAAPGVDARPLRLHTRRRPEAGRKGLSVRRWARTVASHAGARGALKGKRRRKLALAQDSVTQEPGPPCLKTWPTGLRTGSGSTHQRGSVRSSIFIENPSFPGHDLAAGLSHSVPETGRPAGR